MHSPISLHPLTAGSDYVAVNLELDIGMSPFTFEIQLLEDNDVEQNEVFLLQLTAGAGSSIDPATGLTTVEITENDRELTARLADPKCGHPPGHFLFCPNAIAT